MAISLVKTVNFGAGKTGKVGSVGYTLYNTLGTETASRATAGVYEVAAGSGLYGIQISVANVFSGSIVWDVETVHAVDEVNTATEYTRQMTEGRWKIDSSTNQMIFYSADNVTEIARFDLKDSDGTAAVANVFERLRV